MEKLFDINEEGYSIRSKIFCNDIHKIEKVIIFGHGFGGNKDNKQIARFAGQVLSKYKKVALLSFDWPCHGKDARKKLEISECMEYLRIVIEDIPKRFGAEEIYAYATSFGAFIMLNYIAAYGSPFKKMVFRSPAINMYDNLVQRLFTEEDLQKIEKGKDVLAGYDRKVKFDKKLLNDMKEKDVTKIDFLDYAEDMMIVHGTKDEVVPFEPVREFAEENVIEFLPVENADHRFKDQNKLDVVSNQIIEFFDF